MSPPVTVAVVNTNGRDLLAACLRSLAPEVDAGRAAVWVVDNASTDGSPALVEREFPWATLVASPENLGFPQAVNLVADRTDSAWLATANEDVELEGGALEALLQVGERHPEAGAVAPRLVLPGGTTQHSVGPFPTVGVTLIVNLGLHRLVPSLGDRLCLHGSWDADRPREVPWAMAAFMLVRRAAFDAVGGFDRGMWMYADDVDLAWRLRRAGWVIRYEPSACVRHEGGASSARTFGDEDTRVRMAATYAWLAERRGLARTRAMAAMSFVVVAARYALFCALARAAPERFVHRRDFARSWMRAHAEGLRSRREIAEADTRAARVARRGLADR